MSDSSPVASVKMVSPGNVHAGFVGAATVAPGFGETREAAVFEAFCRFAANEDASATNAKTTSKSALANRSLARPEESRGFKDMITQFDCGCPDSRVPL